MSEVSAATTTPRPIWWKIVVGGVVVAIVVGWIASVLDLKRVWQALQMVNYPLALASAVPVIASHWMRAVRWRTMLNAVSDLPRFALWDLFSAVMVGYVANNIIPRSGEVVRPYVLARRYRVPSALMLASVLAERIVDVLQLVLFLAAAILFLPAIVERALPGWIIGQGLQSLAIVLLVLIAIVVIGGLSSAVERVIVAVLRRFLPRRAAQLESIVSAFRRGIRIMRHGKDALVILVESALIWILYAVPLWIAMLAVPMTLPAGFTWSFWDACIVLLVVAVATTVAPTPGAIGVVHALVAEAMLRLYSVPLEEAFVYITIAHAINYLTVMVVGAWFTAREGISLSSVLLPSVSDETAPSATEQTSA